MNATRKAASGAINVKAVVTECNGQTHTQIFLWEDRNALAMQDRILAQQKLAERRRAWKCLRIDTPRLLDLLSLVLTTAPDEDRHPQQHQPKRKGRER